MKRETFIIRLTRPRGMSQRQMCTRIRQCLKQYDLLATVRREFVNEDKGGYTYKRPKWSSRKSMKMYPGNK